MLRLIAAPVLLAVAFAFLLSPSPLLAQGGLAEPLSKARVTAGHRWVAGKLLKVHVYRDGSWPGKGGTWVPGAEVTITQKNTSFRRVGTTDEYSDVSFYVTPGEYEIYVRKPGVGEGRQTVTVPEAGLFVSFPLSRPAVLANFPKDKILLYPRPKLPGPKLPGPR